MEHTLLINALNRIFAGFITTHWSPPSGPWPENIIFHIVCPSPRDCTNFKFRISTFFSNHSESLLSDWLKNRENSPFGIRVTIWWNSHLNVLWTSKHFELQTSFIIQTTLLETINLWHWNTKQPIDESCLHVFKVLQSVFFSKHKVSITTFLVYFD